MNKLAEIIATQAINEVAAFIKYKGIKARVAASPVAFNAEIEPGYILRENRNSSLLFADREISDCATDEYAAQFASHLALTIKNDIESNGRDFAFCEIVSNCPEELRGGYRQETITADNKNFMLTVRESYMPHIGKHAFTFAWSYGVAA